jgi:hypothetical protein
MAPRVPTKTVKPKLAQLQQMLTGKAPTPPMTMPAMPTMPVASSKPLSFQPPVRTQPIAPPTPLTGPDQRKAARKAANPPKPLDPKKAANRAARRIRKGKPPLAY